jgi:hypothetical protein
MDIWKSVVELNNSGVALLLQNKIQAAVPLFTDSLTLIKTIMHDQQQGPESTAATTMQLFQQHDATHAALSKLQDEHSFVWNEVFTISDRGTDFHILESESQIIYAGIIIFNIALIHHRQGKLGHPSCLAKAGKMYDMVTALLGCDSYTQGTALIVKLAALNNRSLIQYEQTNYDASRRGFEQLVWTVNSSTTHLLPPASLVNVNSMLLNALMLISSCHQPSAAPTA